MSLVRATTVSLSSQSLSLGLTKNHSERKSGKLAAVSAVRKSVTKPGTESARGRDGGKQGLHGSEELGDEVARQSGMKKAKVALARKLAIIMHGMLADGTVMSRRSEWRVRMMTQIISLGTRRCRQATREGAPQDGFYGGGQRIGPGQKHNPGERMSRE
jgi:hypothetical protein